jgi:hypothetical protein
MLQISAWIMGVLIVGNFLYHFLTAKPGPPPGTPSKPGTSESVWYDGED